MDDHSGSFRFPLLFEAALQQYEKQTEISLTKHPLAEQLQNCDSVDIVIALLQEQVQAFSEFRGTDRIMKSLKGIVSVLSTLSAVASLSDSIGLVRRKTPKLFPCSNTYPLVISTCKSNTCWHGHPTLRMYLLLSPSARL